jgi:signal transduction histidine kinase
LKEYFKFLIRLKDELDNQIAANIRQEKLASIGQLAAGVGHEINNPLAVALGMSQLIKLQLEKTGHLDSGLNEKFQKINTAGERIAGIIKGLKNFSRQDGEETDVFNLNEIATETQSLYSDHFKRDQIQLVFNFSPEPLPVKGIRGQIQQVLINLMNNARDATEGCAVRLIEITTTRQDGDALLLVKDTGSGIPPEIQDQIFDAFFTTKPINQGTGLGLSLVSTMIQNHGGKISFTTQAKQGTTFKVSLPIVQ